MKHCIIKVSVATLLPFAFLAITVGLTFAPCYATLCTEDFLPRETKIQLGAFYIMLALSLLVSSYNHILNFAKLYALVARLSKSHSFKSASPWAGS